MNHRNVLSLAACYLLAFSLIFPSGCSSHHAPTLYERSPHTAAVVIASSPVQSRLQEMPAGKGEGASRSAGSAVGSLWSGCGHALPAGGNELSAFFGIGVLIVCAALTPIVGIGGAIAGAVNASPAKDVDRLKQELAQNLPDRDRAIALFEQNLYYPREKVAGHAFKSGKVFGLLDRRPDGDYRDLAAQGVDAVLEVDGLAVALAGKNLDSPLSLRACTSVKLIDSLDNSVLYQANRCEGVDSVRSLDAWSADQWAALKTDSDVAIERLANNLAWYIFHGNKEPGAHMMQVDMHEKTK